MTTATTMTVTTASEPSRSGRLLGLVAALIDYARQLVTTLQRQGAVGLAGLTASGFYTADVAQVLLRVSRGLLRAEALEARLTLRARHLDAPRRPQTATAAARRATAPARPRPRTAATDLIRLPTPEEVAIEVRRQPIGAVLVNICCDLGILPCHPLWQTLRRAIMDHGGSYVRLLIHVIRRPAITVGLAMAAATGMRPTPLPTG